MKLLTGALLREHHPGLGGDVGAADEQLVSPGNGAAGGTEALHQREILTGALGWRSRRVRLGQEAGNQLPARLVSKGEISK